MAKLSRLEDRRQARKSSTRSTADATKAKGTKAPVGIKSASKTANQPKRRFSREHRENLAEANADQPRQHSGLFQSQWPEEMFDAVEQEYRAGDLPIAEISRIYGPSPATIVQRMKQRGVSRDLTGKVAAKLREKILSDGQRIPARANLAKTPLTEDEKIAEAAAARAFKTVKLHQRGAAKLREYTEKIIKRMPTKTELKDPKIVKMFSEAARNAALAYDKLVSIERKAFAIDEKEEGAKRLKIELD